MAFINRDFLGPSVMGWNSYSRLYQRFDRVWGKHIDGGIEVYDQVFIYWHKSSGYLPDTINGRPSPFQRLLNAVGMEYKELTKESNKGAEYVYFTFDWTKLTYTKPTASEIASKLNITIPLDEPFSLNVRYTGTFGDVVPTHFIFNPLATNLSTTNLSNYTTDAPTVIATLESNPVMYFANATVANSGTNINNTISNIQGTTSFSGSSTSPTPITIIRVNNGININSSLALLDNGTSFQKIGISNIKFKILDNKLKTVDIQYDITYKRIANTTSTSHVVSTIDTIAATIVNVRSSNSPLNRSNVKFIVEDNLLKKAIQEMDDSVITEYPITHNGKLRVDSASLMKRKEFGDLFAKTIKADYKEEDEEWYEVALAIILIVVAVVVTIMSFGASAGGLAALATALATGSAILSIGYIVYASIFPYAGDMIKLIGKFAQIIGIAASITGVFAFIQSAFNKLAAEAGKKALEEGAKKGASKQVLEQLKTTAINNYGVGDFINDMFNKWFDDVTTKLTNMFSFDSIANFKFGDLTGITLNDVSGWLDNLTTGMQLYNKFFDNDAKAEPVAEDQAVREDGVEPFFASLAMLDEVDALVKMDKIKTESFGGVLTDNLLIKMY